MSGAVPGMDGEPVHLSIVSHRQRALVGELLRDLAGCRANQFTITVLSNTPEPAPDIPPALAGKVEHLVNPAPAGYGANHNFVFRRCRARFFGVLNPDLRFPQDPFPALLPAFADPHVAIVAPGAVDPLGEVQDNARRLATIGAVASKTWRRQRGPDYPQLAGEVSVDWLAGFFLLCRSSAFRDLGGFDERYFLYYEDVDLCTRVRLAGWRNVWMPAVRIIHDARRRSHRHPRYLLWHLASIGRFFSSPVYRAARKRRPPRM